MAPNKPKTPTRGVRIDGDLWEYAKRVADVRGESLTDVIRAALEQYVDNNRAEVEAPTREPKVYDFNIQDLEHHFAPTGHADSISGRVRVRDNDLRVGDLLLHGSVFAVVDSLKPTNRGDQIMTGHIDWDLSRERYGSRTR